jgi:hypothetical protein
MEPSLTAEISSSPIDFELSKDAGMAFIASSPFAVKDAWQFQGML